MSSFGGVASVPDPGDLKGVWMIGTVVDNNDPDMMERIKVTIPNLFEGEPRDFPWVAPAKAGWFPNTSAFGVFGLIPPLGAKIWVFFQQGNPLYPMYSAYPHTKGGRPDEFKTNYLKRYGFKDPEGNVFIIDTTPGAASKVQFLHVSGFTLNITSVGRLTIHAPDDVYVQATDVRVQNGTVYVTNGDVIADGISLKGHVHMEQGDGSPTSPPL